MMLALFLVYLLTFVFTAQKKLSLARELDLIPSFIWTIGIVIPFIFQYQSFNPEFVPIQTFGIFCIGFTLVLGDLSHFYLYELKRTKKSAKIKPESLLPVGYLLFTAFVLIQTIGIARMPHIPLYWKWFAPKGTLSNLDLAKMREAAAKTLTVSPLFMYLTNASVNVLGPASIAIFANAKKYRWVLICFVTIGICSRITNAKSPFYVVCLFCIGIAWLNLNLDLRKTLLKAGTAVCTLILVSVALLLSIHRFGAFKYRVQDGDRFDKTALPKLTEIQKSVFTTPDHMRRVSDLNKDYYDQSQILLEANYFVYRFFLVPTEVAHWWYIYYPRINGAYLGFSGLNFRDRHNPAFVHPANRVGIMAFSERHPGHYLNTVSAFGSVDADAYSRWGFWGIVAISCLLFLFRLSVKFFSLPGFWGEFFGFGINTILAYTLPSGSFLAALIAQGAFVYFALELGLWLLVRRKAWVRG